MLRGLGAYRIVASRDGRALARLSMGDTERLSIVPSNPARFAD